MISEGNIYSPPPSFLFSQNIIFIKISQPSEITYFNFLVNLTNKLDISKNYFHIFQNTEIIHYILAVQEKRSWKIRIRNRPHIIFHI